MALVLADRVLETTTTTGSGTITLAGAEPGYQSFSVIGNGNQTYYTITANGGWEVGIGTYTASGTTLSRDTVLASSNSGQRLTLSAGSKNVFVTYPAEKSVNFDVSGNISASSGIISNVGYPSANSDAATKLYVDTLAAEGISYHTPVKYEVPNTTGNLNATYNNGTAGVSATLTNAGTLGPFVPDGVTASISDRILIYNQTNAVQNGVYVVTTVGTGASSWVLTRAADANTYGVKSPTALGTGDAFYVTSGNTGAGETYVCNTPGTIVFGSTNITFVQVSAAQVYSAGNGLSLTNTVFSLATPVAVANGGTGTSSTPTNGQLLIGNGSGYTLSTLTAGSGVSITNSAGSITLTATGTGGTVVAVTASAPLASTGGVSPNISIANSTGTGNVVLDNGASIFSATITGAVSASITTITGSSANITTVTGTTAGFSSAAITQLSGTSAGITTVSGTTTTFSSGTITQFGATSATITTLSGTNVTYPNANFTSATVTNLGSTSANITTLTGSSMNVTTATHASANITTINGTSADITTITGTTIGTTASATIRGISGAITTISGTTATYTSATVTNLALTSLTLANLSITSANVTTLTSASATITNLLATTLTVSGNTFLATTTGAVGVGTTSPIQALHIGSSASSGTVSRLLIACNNDSATTQISLGARSSDGLYGTRISAITNLNSTLNADLTFSTTSATGTFERVRITSAGLVGIGKTPTTMLDVSGTITGTAVSATDGTFTSATVTNLNSTSANITTLTGTTFGTTATTQLRGASADITTLTGTTFGTTATTQLRGASGAITTLTGTSADITTITGTTIGTTASATIRGISGAITTVSGTTLTYTSGTITNLAATSITVTNTPAFVGNGTLTMNVSGTGLSGSQTFTANQSSNATFTVTSNATSANTASTIVARDASGNFSAGTITATLNGNASTATSATSATSATTATTATNQSGGTVSATSGTFSTTLGVTGRASLNGGFQGTVARGSYGSISLYSSLNGYSGIDVNDQAVTWMTNSSAVSFGAYKNNSAWAFYFDMNGVLQIGTVPGGSVTGAVSSATSATTATNVSGGGQISAASGTITTLNDGAGLIRSIPSAGTTKTTAYTLATTDNGEHVTVGSGGSIVVPNSTFSAGMCVSIYNDTTGGISINISLTTCYVAGTNTNRTGVTLATRGLATILFISSTQGVISGNVT